MLEYQKDQNITRLLRMSHSEVRNYVIPGLTSRLLSAKTESGCTRIFTMDRVQHGEITPHSHRFDFVAVVLAGWVVNRIWEVSEDGDQFRRSQQRYGGDIGQYEQFGNADVRKWVYRAETYCETGSTYSMTADQVHSIQFSRGAAVLMVEGPQQTDVSYALEPWVDGAAIDTLKVEPWMFARAVK